VPLVVLPASLESAHGAGSSVGGLELPISPAALGSAASEQSGWGESEFQTVTEAASGLISRRPFPTVDPLADESGTFPWIKSDLVASLL
jgi:hypothetical protein